MAKTPEELKADYEAGLKAYAGSNSAKQREVMEMLNVGLNLGANFMDLGISRSQISEGQRLREGISSPQMFTPTRDRSLLQGRISAAQRNVGNVRQDLAPAEIANLDQYLKDIGTARIASGGQASLFGAMGNAASLRRRRGGLEIAALGSQIKRQNRGELNQLIGMDLADRAAYEGRKLTANELALDRYYKESADAAGLESAGRANRRESIYNMLPNISQGIGQLGQMDFGQMGQGVGDWWRGRQTRRSARRGVPVLNFNNAGSPGEMMNTMGGGIRLT